MTLKIFIFKSEKFQQKRHQRISKLGKPFFAGKGVEKIKKAPPKINFIPKELEHLVNLAKNYKTSEAFRKDIKSLFKNNKISREDINLVRKLFDKEKKLEDGYTVVSMNHRGFDDFYKLATQKEKHKIPTWLKIGAGILLAIVAFVTVLAPTAQALQGEGAMAEIEAILKRGAEENEKEFGLANQRLHFSDLGFESEMSAKMHLNNIVEDFSIKNESLGNNWSHNDKIMFANFVKIANEDISHTILNSRAGYNQKYFDPIDNGWQKNTERAEYSEANPLVRPFVSSNSDVYRIAGFVGQGYLADRWNKMENSSQKSVEILVANLIEVAATRNSGHTWKMQFGVDFDA